MLEVIFWSSLGVMVFVYLGYPLVVIAWAQIFHGHGETLGEVPTLSVSVIVPCHNEEEAVVTKGANTLALEHPGAFEAVFVDDVSSDDTGKILDAMEDPRVRVLHNATRLGKLKSLRQAASQAQGEILLFTDCAARLGPLALKHLLRHFNEPKTGLVTGQYRAVNPTQDARARGEGLYWRYEMALRRAESRLSTTTHATGAVFAVRTRLFRDIQWREDATNDDIFVPIRILQAGYDVRCEPLAEAVEHVEIDLSGEFRRRARIASGNFQMVPEIPGLLRAGRWFATFQLVFHKLLRNAGGVFLGLMLASSSFLAMDGENPIWWAILALQLLFWGVALYGWMERPTGRVGRMVGLPLYFAMGNLASLKGLWLWLVGQSMHIWERTDRFVEAQGVHRG